MPDLKAPFRFFSEKLDIHSDFPDILHIIPIYQIIEVTLTGLKQHGVRLQD